MTRSYQHTQIAWPMIGSVGSLTLVGMLALLGLPFGRELEPMIVIAPIALLLNGSLTVTVNERYLIARFGIGLIFKRVDLREIRAFHRVQNPWYYFWGIRFIPGGKLYNVSGFSAVDVLLTTGKHVRIGTDEPDVLVEVLRQILGRAPALHA